MYDTDLTRYQEMQVPSQNLFGFLAGFYLVGLFLVIIIIVALWKVFKKAGQPGWASLIPIYNIYVLLKITGKPAWWLILFFFPLLNWIMSIVVMLSLARAFGKSVIFAIFGLILFPFVGLPILGFGKSAYQNTTPAAPVPQAQ